MKYGPWVLSVIAILIALGGQHAVFGETEAAADELRAKSIVLLDADGGEAFRISTRDGYAVFEPTKAGEDPWEVRIGGDRGEMVFAREARTSRIDARGIDLYSASKSEPVVRKLLSLRSFEVALRSSTESASYQTIVKLVSTEPGEGGLVLHGDNRLLGTLWTVRGEDGVLLPYFSLTPFHFQESSAKLDVLFDKGLPRIVLHDKEGNEAAAFEIPNVPDDNDKDE
jgi:hypothetical protein